MYFVFPFIKYKKVPSHTRSKFLLKNLRNRLHICIFVELTAKKKHITIHDLARELGMSASTVSRALKDHPRISKSTRELVRRHAELSNYQPNRLAASLRKGKGNTVGVIVPNINRSFFSNIIGGIEEELSQSGYNLMICQSKEKLEKEKDALATLLDARVDGILMSISMETTSYGHLEKLLGQGIRLVFFDRVPSIPGINSVIIDDYHAAYELTKTLLAKGFRRPAHIGGSSKINVYAMRQKGYLDALRDSGMEARPECIIETDMTREGGREAFGKLTASGKYPDSFVCSGDYTALGILDEARRCEKKLPYPIAVTGFANEEFTSLVHPGITSVDQRGFEIGQKAALLYLEDPSLEDKTQLMLRPEIIYRESSEFRKQKTKIQ